MPYLQGDRREERHQHDVRGIGFQEHANDDEREHHEQKEHVAVLGDGL